MQGPKAFSFDEPETHKPSPAYWASQPSPLRLPRFGEALLWLERPGPATDCGINGKLKDCRAQSLQCAVEAQKTSR